MIVASHQTWSQDNPGEQLWAEYMLNYPFANIYNLENSFSYSTNLGTKKWRAFDFAPTLERAFTQNVDGMAGVTFSSTFQNDTSNTLEIRPMVGVRFHLTPNRRVLSRLLMRFEQRNFQDRESLEWERSARFRVRPELLVPLNRDSYFEDDVWYAVLDAEWFVVAGQDVEERYANRFRLRTGAGYRWNGTWRFEVLYVRQEARNTIGEDYYTSDNILRLRIKHFINRSAGHSAPSSGTDGL